MGGDIVEAEDLAVGGGDEKAVARRRDAVRVAEEEGEGAGEEKEDEGQNADAEDPE
jgi:hypothetical protein